MEAARNLAARALMVFIIVAAFMAAIRASHAHDYWATGEPIPAWIKASCCGPEDVHRYTMDQIRETKGGYIVPGYKSVIPNNKPLASQDQYAYVFFRDYPDGSQSGVYCIFLPVSF